MMSVQPSFTRSSPVGMELFVKDVKLMMRSFCQPGSSDATHSGSVGALFRTPMEDGVRCTT